MIYVGIDVGGTGIQVGLVDESGKILCKGGIVTRTDIPFDMQVKAMADCVLDTIDQDFLDKVKEKGDYLRTQIEAMDIPCLGKTRGMGLMIGIDVKGERTNKELAAKLIQSGLLVLTAGPGLRLLPPLVITQEEMDKGLAIMKAALS